MIGTVLFDQSSIDDVMQEAFVRVLQSRKDFSDRKEAFHYLRKTVFSTTIDSYRRLRRCHKKVVSCYSSPESILGLPQNELDPLAHLILEEQAEQKRQLVRQIKAAVASLPPSQKQAIELFYGRGKKRRLKEVCQDSGIPYSTLRSRMMRGIKSIRVQLHEKGVVEFPD